jgi:hypothetical protein
MFSLDPAQKLFVEQLWLLKLRSVTASLENSNRQILEVGFERIPTGRRRNYEVVTPETVCPS